MRPLDAAELVEYGGSWRGTGHALGNISKDLLIEAID